MAKKCKRFKRVFSKKLGKKVRRCAAWSGTKKKKKKKKK